MNLRILLTVGLTCLAATEAAWGQSPPSPEASVGYQGLPAKVVGSTQSGVPVSEGSLLHLGVARAGGSLGQASATAVAPGGDLRALDSVFAALGSGGGRHGG